MKKIALISLLTCATLKSLAQVNFVKNPSFEKYDTCPYKSGQIILAKNWQNAIVPNFPKGIEYFHHCAGSNFYTGCPSNTSFYQEPHLGDGMVGIQLYYDKTFPFPPAPLPINNREYLQGVLLKKLIIGRTYCVSFWIIHAEASGYAHNKIGTYLDDGTFNTLADSAGEEITSVLPQIYTDSILKDTMRWEKVEGAFIANGTETHITLGLFFTNSVTSKVVTNYWFKYEQYLYYLIDDVSVIPTDLPADAGKDTWVEVGKQVQIGRVGDTTAQGLDCKWYKKGVLIDSGAIITVNANSIINQVDTYVVVQNICGVIKRDTVNVKTTGLGIPLLGGGGFSIYPNPSNGNITITTNVIARQASLATAGQAIYTKVYDLLGRVVHQELLNFSNKEATLKLNILTGSYILELKDKEGNVQRERIVIE
jgi:hypothetical protein